MPIRVRPIDPRDNRRKKIGRRGLQALPGRKGAGSMMDDQRLPRDYRKKTEEEIRDRLKKQRPMGRLTGGQIKIAAKAPPRNKITGADFAVLQKEKAKGRGKGLQDEKMKPGKVMKANSGDMAKKKNFRGFSKVFQGPQDKGRVATISGTKPTLRANSKAAKAARFALKAARATTIGKIALGVAAVGLGAKEYLKRKMKKNKEKAKVQKKMGGGMMMQRPMMARSGRLADLAKKKGVPTPLVKGPKGFFKDVGKFPGLLRLKPKKKMGGGMMMRPNPVGYKTGRSVNVKCKLGKNKPTKMY
jgi:hypothetical protein